LDIRDNGRGIEPAIRKNIFKPGFSTKKRGWGLGLSLAKRIIEDYHHGKLFLKETRVGEGSTMRIVL
jgi:signal transduction histidine kinase